MMKIRSILFLFFVIGTLACHRKTCGLSVFRPTSCEIIDISMNHTDSISGQEITDSMFLNVFFQGDIVEACADNFNFSFGNEAMALVTVIANFESPLKSFEITSNQAFNEIPAGQSLKNKLWGINGLDKMSVEEYLQPYIEGTVDFSRPIDFFSFQFKEKPNIPIQNLNVLIVFKDNRRFEIKNTQFVWK